MDSEDSAGDPPSKYKKWFSARMKEASALMDDIGNWGSNVGTAAGMTSDWATGSGAGSTIFVGGRVANAMSNANRVNQARSFYYNKYKGVSNLKGTSVEGFKGSFGLSGLLHPSTMLLMHEYGHYLHAQDASLNFYSYAMWSSAATANFSWAGTNWTEIKANTYSYYYFGQPKGWNFVEYPVNANYLSPQTIQNLQSHK